MLVWLRLPRSKTGYRKEKDFFGNLTSLIVVLYCTDAAQPDG